ncbi:transposase [Pigmentiphaga sp. D-2]|uniref:IS66-like element accessory protein TnpA n=1 Tax=Pigmentiphaga sp. D-2 TaxID=1002116 RepID=UPI00104BDB09|nr:transposase [Pigmentiphaga sp. D-2]
MARTELSEVRQRRTYPKAFKAQVVAECGEPQASIASVALTHGLNANLVHKWLRLAQGRAGSEPAFVPVVPAGRTQGTGQPIELEIRRGGVQVLVRWPAGEAITCAVWLSECLK